MLMAGNTVYVQGSYVDVHDNGVVNLSIDKAGEVRVAGNAVAAEGEAAEGKGVKDGQGCSAAVPAALLTAEAEKYWQRLRTAGFIVSGGYGLGADVSANQAAYIADCMARRLGITNKWKVFQQLWGTRNMAQLAGSWQQTGKLPPRSKEIERLME